MSVRYIKCLFVFTLIVSACKAQTYSSIVSDKEVVVFVKGFFVDNRVIARQIDLKIRPWFIDQLKGGKDSHYKGIINIDSCKKYLSNEDIVFLEQQIKSRVDSTWHKGDFEGYKLFDNAAIKEVYRVSRDRKARQKVKYNYYFWLSIPLFNQRKDIAIVFRSYVCGFLCASECLYLYRFYDGKWNKITEWDCYSD